VWVHSCDRLTLVAANNNGRRTRAPPSFLAPRTDQVHPADGGRCARGNVTADPRASGRQLWRRPTSWSCKITRGEDARLGELGSHDCAVLASIRPLGRTSQGRRSNMSRIPSLAGPRASLSRPIKRSVA
jgi:hypothetical protein